MRRLSLVAVLLSVVIVGLVYGCGARMEVAKDKLRNKIDALLGTLDVKRKEIELGIDGLKEGIDGLRRARVRAQVSSEQIGRQAQPLEERLAGLDQALKKLRGHLETKQPVELAGKTYSPRELEDLADRLLVARKPCAGQVEVLHAARQRLHRVADTLARKQAEAEGRLADIEGQVAVIDSNRIALTSMQQAAEAMGGNDRSLAQSLDHLANKVNSLFVSVETELRVEDDRWAAADAKKELNAVDTVISTLQPTDRIAEIDKILSATKR